jgi:hypothetical protein
VRASLSQAEASVFDAADHETTWTCTYVKVRATPSVSSKITEHAEQS